jgi:deoxyribonuclease V
MMRIPPAPHPWSLSPRRAIAVQRRLASKVIQETSERKLRWVAGLDAAFSPEGQSCIAAVALWDLREQEVAIRRLTFPYIPGLLSFREAPALLAALRKLKRTPDLLMCDGQGLAHPRRFGIACHVGVICQLPAVGCAKSRLVGTHTEPLEKRGSFVPLSDQGEEIGEVVRTQTGVKPIYVSVGHKIGLRTARQIVLECALKYRLPEPTRLADRLVAAIKHNLR